MAKLTVSVEVDSVPANFAVTLECDEDDAWVAECALLPGCISQGTTRQEAIENIRDAIKLCLEVRAGRYTP